MQKGTGARKCAEIFVCNILVCILGEISQRNISDVGLADDTTSGKEEIKLRLRSTEVNDEPQSCLGNFDSVSFACNKTVPQTP